jgi:hypothetical protein
MKLRLVRSLLVAALVPQIVAAQGIISAGVGGGGGVGRHHGPAADGSHGHGLAYVQLGLPLFPLAVRGDALLMAGAGDAGPLALSANAVFSLPIPIVTPYLTAGYGAYGVGQTGRANGWSAGVGARAKLPVLPGIFAEARRHQRLGRDLFTVGLVF